MHNTKNKVINNINFLIQVIMYLDPTKTNYRLTSKYCSQKQCMCENATDSGYCEFTACIYEDALNRGKNEKQIISIPKITIS